MSTSNNNLLNFLQNQSLFNNSPTKNVNRKMSSRSREKGLDQQWPGGANVTVNANQSFGQSQNFNTGAPLTVGQNTNSFAGGLNNGNAFSSAQINTNSFTVGQGNVNQHFSAGQNLSAGQNINSGQNFSQTQTFNSGQAFGVQTNFQDNNAQIKLRNPSQFSSSFQNQQQFGSAKVESSIQSPTKSNFQASFSNNNANFGSFNSGAKLNENTYTFNSYQQQIVKHPGSKLQPTAQNYLENVVNYAVDSTNYARNEAMKRLDLLAEKVRIQINSLNSKLEGFNSQMMSIVISEFNFVKGKVYEILEETFRESEKYCRGYISTVETEFNEDVLKARASLQRQSENIELMKIDINKPHWQSNAVFVSVEFEARVNKVISQVQVLEVKSIQTHTNQTWQMNLKRDLLDRVIARLQREREMAFGRAM